MEVPVEGSPESGPGMQPSRRSVLHGAAGLAGAGLAGAVIAGAPTAPASAAAAPRVRSGPAANVASSADPVIVHVRDLQSGEMDVFAGERKVRLHDRDLAARLAKAVR
jgi:hypothetical protein